MPLAQGHRRRIFFGVEKPNDANTRFGIGYEEVDRKGVVVKQLPVSAFDPASTIICVPLGVGDAAGPRNVGSCEFGGGNTQFSHPPDHVQSVESVDTDIRESRRSYY